MQAKLVGLLANFHQHRLELLFEFRILRPFCRAVRTSIFTSGRTLKQNCTVMFVAPSVFVFVGN